MFETTAILYAETITQDAALNEVKTYTGRKVFVRKTRSISRSEFYQAAAQGLKPAAVLILFFGDYSDEKVIGWQGKYYRITRTYQRPDSDDIELTIEEAQEFKNGINEEDEDNDQQP